MLKSIKEIAWNVKEEEYRKDPAFSYSQIAKFEREGWRNLVTLFDRVDTPSLTFGSAVDTLTLPVEGEKQFNDLFMICDFPALSDTLISITKDLFALFGKKYAKLSDIPEVEISNAAIRNNYYVADRYAAFRVKTIKEQCEEYYKLLALAGDKTILSSEDYKDVLDCVNELKSNKYSKPFIVSDPWDKETELVYQLKFKGNFQGIQLRCMFDALKVDHANKIIMPIDLKTTGHPEEEFESSFFKWKYYIQARLYTYILKQNLEKDDYFKDFNVLFYRFVVINRKTKSPIVWIFDGSQSNKDLYYKNELYRDWRPIVEELDWYLKNPDTQYEQKVLKSLESSGGVKISYDI